MPATARQTPPDARQRATRAFFWELHGRRLHGFALLLTLGNRALAARLSSDALAAAAQRGGQLRHPERAAAWLRATVLRRLPRRHPVPSPAEERLALEPLQVDRAVADGLAALSPRERAAIVASDVELLDRRDVEDIVGRSGAAFDRLLAAARERYMQAYTAAPVGEATPAGPLVERVRDIAVRVLG
jgi:DNA-directed RNA polymerase specialized sigma24 family protein